MAAFLLQWDWVVAAETVSPIKPKGFVIWPFTEKLQETWYSVFSDNPSSVSPITSQHSSLLCPVVQPHLLGFPHVAPNGWPILQSCAWRLALLLSVAADFVLGFLCWMESINICHEVTVSKRVKLNFRPGRDQPLMVKLPLYSVDNVKTRGGWGTACDHKSRGWLSRSTLGLLALVPLLFPQVPYCWHAYAHAQTKHVPCGLPFRLNTIFFISTVHALIPAWPERDDLRSEAKAKILLMLEVCSVSSLFIWTVCRHQTELNVFFNSSVSNSNTNHFFFLPSFKPSNYTSLCV